MGRIINEVLNSMWRIGDAIKELREDKRLTQAELGSIIGVSGKTISNYEKGDREPSIEVITNLANYFEVSTDYLISGKENIVTDKGVVKLKFKSGNSALLKKEETQRLIKMLEDNKIDAEALIEELKKRS